MVQYLFSNHGSKLSTQGEVPMMSGSFNACISALSTTATGFSGPHNDPKAMDI